MRSDLLWALNKSYKAHLVFKIRRTRLSGHVQALKYTKTRDLSLFRLLIRPTQPNGHVLALKSTKDARSDPIWAILNIPGHLFCWRYLWLSTMAVHRFLDTILKLYYI